MQSRSFHILALLCVLCVDVFSQSGTYQYKLNQPYRYAVEGTSDILREAMGQTMTTNTETAGSIVLTVDKIFPDGNMHCNIKIEKMLIMLDNAQGSQTLGGELTGKEFGYTMNPTGKIVERDSSVKDLPQEAGLIAGQLFRMFPRLKMENLKPGNEWDEERVDTTGTGDDQIISTSRTTYKTAGEETIKSQLCLAIGSDGTVEIDGKTAQGGKDLRISGQTASKGTIYFNVTDGILVKLVSEMTGDQEVRDPNSSMKMNMTMSGKQSVELITE